MILLKKYQPTIWLCTLLIFCACGPPEQILRGTAPFFDLKSYFSDEIKRLGHAVKGKKSIRINGTLEEKDFDVIDIENDLSAFIASDINKPTWYDQYAIDSVFNNAGELTKIQYTARKDILKTQKIEVQFKAAAVSGIIIENANNNLLENSQQYLSYFPDEGYEIKINQKIILSPAKEIVVKMTSSLD